MKENFLKFAKLTTSILVLIYGLFLTGSVTQMTKPEPVVETRPEIKKIVDAKQLSCMAKNIFYEAGGESVLGQAAVARVVMNRVQHGFGKNPCTVVYQATYLEKINNDGLAQQVKLCQFSWVCEGKSEPNKNNQRYKQAQQVAYDVMVNDAYSDVVPKSTLFFHNVHVDPMWPYKQVKKIGNHIFYSKYKKQKTKTDDA